MNAIPNTARYLFGIQGKTLSREESDWLKHPLTAGVILFTRNYDNPAQLRAFVKTLRQTAETAGREILIAVDHEGGRVQRFREGFTAIPAMATLGAVYDKDKDGALTLARDMAYVMAYELADCDIDFSFAPVLDVQTDFSKVIGDRAFHHDTSVIALLANAFYQGLGDAGMIGVGKHFPGHGNVVADSHLELPMSDDDFNTLKHRDLPPFAALIQAGIEAIMPAHILYRAIDDMPAGFSTHWLQNILREQMGFTGCIISDDLDMAGAGAYGSMAKRVELATKNCDLLLLCNRQDDMRIAFASLEPTADDARQARIMSLKRDKSCHDSERYQIALRRVLMYK